MIMRETKRCPYCGEEILAVAKKCKHCGEGLEKKDSEKEKKACPTCGELVDVDKETCPFCNETTHFSDAKAESVIAERIESKDENADFYLYCKSCKTKLHMDSDSCNKCGDKDPFFFKKIKRFVTISSWGACAIILGLLYFSSEYMGFRLNITPAWLEFICFMVIFIILGGIVDVLIRKLLFQSYIRDYENIMNRLFGDMGNPSAINSWKAKVEKIL